MGGVGFRPAQLCKREGLEERFLGYREKSGSLRWRHKRQDSDLSTVTGNYRNIAYSLIAVSELTITLNSIMRVIQALARYFPDKCGGIQVNLSELIPQLQYQNVEIKIAAAKVEVDKENTYQLNDVEVYRYPISSKPKPQPNHGQFAHQGFKCFAKWLSSQKANIYHQHHWEVTCGLPHLRLAKQLGMNTIVTVHYPIPICQRTTLMFNGQEACDGKIDIIRCSRCTDGLSKKLPNQILKNLSRLPISAISRIPLPVSAYLPTSVNEAKGRFIRPFVIPAYVAARQYSLHEMVKYADRIIVVCDWLYKSLLVNGVPEEKLILCRYGISYATSNQFTNNQSIRTSNNSKEHVLKVAYLGRWDVSKGIDILVQAVKNLPPDININLVIHAINQDERYRKNVIEIINDDTRIRISKQLTREELPSVLASYDLLAVPSQWLETGPLVVLESHSVGVPVIGSNLGGISELVRHGVDGWLVSANDPKAWSQALMKLACDTELLKKLRQGIKPVRTITEQATELKQIYQNIYQQR
ncbi:MAG: glycosyltransferase [Calothrix sp. C42_A2020_038]|nr:glycosyltransferase [Calothrix sp. C42_A2020_038]